jgi:hypothetical protein
MKTEDHIGTSRVQLREHVQVDDDLLARQAAEEIDLCLECGNRGAPECSSQDQPARGAVTLYVDVKVGRRVVCFCFGGPGVDPEYRSRTRVFRSCNHPVYIPGPMAL